MAARGTDVSTYMLIAARHTYTCARAQVKMGLYNKQVWTVDYNVTCYEGQHFVLAMALGIPG